MTLTGRTRLKIWLVLAGVFLIGCVTGAALDGAYRTRAGRGRGGDRGDRKHEKMFEEARRELNLDEAQAAKVKAILDETREEFRALHSEMRPRFDQVRQRARARTRETLNPEQQKRFDDMMARRDQKMRERDQQKNSER